MFRYMLASILEAIDLVSAFLVRMGLSLVLVSYAIHKALQESGSVSLRWACCILALMLIWGRPMVYLVGICTALVFLLRVWG